MLQKDKDTSGLILPNSNVQQDYTRWHLPKEATVRLGKGLSAVNKYIYLFPKKILGM